VLEINKISLFKKKSVCVCMFEFTNFL